jgi:hypothetical protein
MLSDWLGFAAVTALVVALIGLVLHSPLPRPLRLLLSVALLLRLVGATARYLVLFHFYGGVGDAVIYYREGLLFADHFRALDLSPIWDQTLWRATTWWGTQFVVFPSGIILSLLGSSILGEFVAFSLLAFAGLVAFAVAFHRSFPHVPLTRYGRWLWLFPSLWFWPSSVGKEALIMCGLGLAVAGFVGKHGRIRWLLLVAGAALVFAVRPQVVAVLVFAFILAQWLGLGERWTIGRVVQALLIFAVGVMAIRHSLSMLGVGSFDVEGVQSYVASEPARRTGGGSAFTGVDVGLRGVPFAMLNVLVRPFPWEAGNAMVLLSSVEVAGFWALVCFRRRALFQSVRYCRSSRLLRVCVPMVLLYSAMLGMTVANFGILARQRIFLFPFLFALLEAVPLVVSRTLPCTSPLRMVRRARTMAGAVGALR